MSYSYSEIRQFRGRYVQRNSFEVPDGALETALNLTVGNDFILGKRRGFYQYYLPGSGTLKKLKKYENRLIAVYDTKISYYTNSGIAPNEVGTETALSNETGLTWSVSSSRVPRMAESNQNLYVTTDAGVIKLTAYNSSVQAVGSPSGEDISATFYPGKPASFFLADKVLGYRIVFGRQDENENTILGAPSDVAAISNPVVENCSYSSTGSGPWTVTVTSTAHGLLTGTYIRTFDSIHASANGEFQITVTGANTFTYVVTSADPKTHTLSYCYAESVLVSASVPEDCASTSQNWFLQLYRSGQYDIAADIYSDYRLILQRALTATEIANNVVYILDDTEETLRGADLYTNENSAEGEFQANARPPKPADIAVFKNYMLYANCQVRPVLEFSLVDPTKINAGDTITIRVTEGVSTTEEIYVAREGAANKLLYSQTITGTNPFTITSDGHGFSNGDIVYFSNILGGSYANQTATVGSVATNTFQVTFTGTGTPTSLWFEGISNGTNPIFRLNKTSTSFATQLQETAQGLIKAISRRASGKLYGRYLSDFSEVPGQIGVLARAFYDKIDIKVSSATTGTAFEPILPTAYGNVFATGSTEKNRLYISKLREPEAVPLLQYLSVGSENSDIYRIAALRDSVIILKEDGVYRLSGDDPTNFVVTILDSTVILGWPDSVDVINNQVAALTNTGVVLISETAVNIISRKIEEDIRPILGRASDLAHGVTYESERIYLLTATLPNEPTLAVCHVYNTLTDEWTTWDKLFIAGVVGPRDTLYQITTDNRILKERKSQTKVDFADQNYPTTITAISGDTITFTVPSGIIPERSDMLVYGGNLNRLETTPIVVGLNTYQGNFEVASTWNVGDSPTLYKKIFSRIITSPFHAGQVGRMKQFAQMQIHTRNGAFTAAKIYFIGDGFLGSSEVDWVAINRRLGFGYFPFGFDFFGQSYGLNLQTGTLAGPICRIYVPIQQQRNTYIQAVIEHEHAGESIELQSIDWAMRAYGERVTK